LTAPIDPKYLRDWSGLARGTPAELHRPRDTAEVASLVRRCNDEGRKVNRRVEVVILDEKAEALTAGEPANAFNSAFDQLRKMFESGLIKPVEKTQ